MRVAAAPDLLARWRQFAARVQGLGLVVAVDATVDADRVDAWAAAVTETAADLVELGNETLAHMEGRRPLAPRLVAPPTGPTVEDLLRLDEQTRLARVLDGADDDELEGDF
jgi:hypothetical protein